MTTTAVEPGVGIRERSPVLRFLARRILGAVLALFAASIVIFAGTVMLPGDAAGVVLGRTATPEKVAKLNHQMHFDRPAYRLYTSWLEGFVQGDLGDSAVGIVQGEKSAPIWPLISNAVKNSAILAAIAALLMIPLSLGLGAIAAVYAGKPVDRLISVVSLAAIALPEFVIGSLLIGIFFVGLNKLLPPVALVPPGASPLGHPTRLVLPVATLLLASLAAGIRMVRAGMVETLQTEYVQTARLNGLAEKRVLMRYAMRNALAPSVQVLAQNLQWLIGGIIITESVFAYPGIGSLLVTAVGNRDVTVVQSVAMLLAIVYVLLNLLADLIVLLLVPKLREPA
ncbi:MAG: peptide/nickel transport system permease protein [Gaiellales bacterium]|jgi:peptide/nickel transport system permease protein|nr:peptide/nickel transport system permease protein [Gaiellales bacterium]